jgi:signal peptidase I
MVSRVAISALLILILLLGTGCLTPIKIEGTAMRPTLEDGDRWLMSRNVSNLERGDIIVFRYPKDQSKWYMKRIIALPGEKVEIREGKTYIDGSRISEDYLDQNLNRAGSSFPEVEIAEGHYFVMGDNRDNSSDSRYWGTVESSLIEGKLYLRYISGNK